jgi:phosphoenolpyruvate carboxykinase (ATP)
VLDPRHSWPNKAGYDETAAGLARRFAANFEQYAHQAGAEVAAAGPRPD